MSKPAKHALTVLASPELRVDAKGLEKLKKAAVAQCAAVSEMEGRAAVGGILAGLTLHRVKASLKHGEFGPWIAQIGTSGSNLAPVTQRMCNNYMRLALVFLEKTKANTTNLLALPGDKAGLELAESNDGRALAEKLQKFVAGCSLNELLIKHGIKGVVREGDAGTEDGGTTAAAGGEDYFADVAQTLDGFRQIVTSRESLVRLSPKQLDLLNETVSDAVAQFRKLYAEARKGAVVDV